MKKYLFIRNDLLEGRQEGDQVTYKQLIEQYVDSMIMNNEIMKETFEIGYWELYNGNDYNEEEDYYKDIYQYFIIDWQSAERLAEDTDEIIYYNEKLDLYLLGVTHFGTAWSGVETDYIITTDYSKYRNQESEVE